MIKYIFLFCFFLPSCFQTQNKESFRIDGSSTLFPISEALTEEFQKTHPEFRATIGISGTGGGFKKFLNEEIEINNASRRITKAEKDLAKKNKIDFVELKIAFDGISVVVNQKNTWLNSLSSKELKSLFSSGSKIKTWKDLNPSFPNQKIKVYGPGHDSGTFDYFTEVINGKSGKIRADYIQSENDNILVSAVKGNVNTISFFGFSYYLENKKYLKAVEINSSLPSVKNIQSQTYKPLSRFLYLYVSKKALTKKSVQAYLKFCFKNAPNILKQTIYIPLKKSDYQKELLKLK